MIEKYIKDGKVAVAYSPEFGAGWSTWVYNNNKLTDTLIFHPDIINMILSNKQSEIDKDWLVEHFGEEFKEVYCGGASNLSIEWIPVGTQFRIDEYDGSESIVELKSDNIYIA
jgi:hypothetical protein